MPSVFFPLLLIWIAVIGIMVADPSGWAAAYGHIFFSLSVGYGIIVTYASYLKRRTDLTGSGRVVAFSTSGFEIPGLAFVAFPAVVSQAPFGALMGVPFFGSLVFAGVPSLISVLEVIVAAVHDKLGWARIKASLVVSVLVAAVSLAFFPAVGTDLSGVQRIHQRTLHPLGGLSRLVCGPEDEGALPEEHAPEL